MHSASNYSSTAKVCIIFMHFNILIFTVEPLYAKLEPVLIPYFYANI